MVQVSNQIFSDLKAEIVSFYPTAKVQKDYQDVATSFSTVTFYEIDNWEFSHTLDYTERKSSITFQIDIYMTGEARETVSKQIADRVNKVMEEKWHTKREYARPTVNIDTNVYRYTMRFSFKMVHFYV